MPEVDYDSISAKLDALLGRMDKAAPTPCKSPWQGTKPPGCTRKKKGGTGGDSGKTGSSKSKPSTAESLKELKEAVQERGGALVATAKPQEEKSKGRKSGKKLSGQAAIDDKYASSNPSDQDVENWKKETAIAASKPSKANINKAVMDDLMVSYSIDYASRKKIKTLPDLAKAISKEEDQHLKEYGEGGKYTWKNFSSYAKTGDRQLAEAEAKVKSARTESGRQKAKKNLEKLKADIKEDREVSELNAKRKNEKLANAQISRLADLEKKYKDEFSKRKSEQEDIHDKVKSGDKKAIADVSRRVLLETGTIDLGELQSRFKGAKGAEKDKRFNDAIKDHLKTASTKNPLKTFGLPSNATPDAVKKAYREQSRKLHPDLNPGKDTKAKMQELNAAYAEYMKGVKGRNDSLADQMLREVFRTDSADMSSYWRIIDLSLEWGAPIEFAR